eukprot:CAMPEP_0170540370 /NCGR_PEP_ID=MMETSP0211-20121228/375_1 /TAXON_ID=311385 /ORGANISM="Pseudokeronopsis sp., Strain OXSARD2" /LENGTH=66 /DNA_ID=CAMNT_0010842745 /DNA_START=233 /DNA_END=433 /DNA_ORIENTATION=-
MALLVVFLAPHSGASSVISTAGLGSKDVTSSISQDDLVLLSVLELLQRSHFSIHHVLSHIDLVQSV